MKWWIAGGGWIVAVLTVWIGYQERTKAREQERLQQTLQYFTGGTQKRSVGIALIEGVWRHKPQYLDILLPVIANQFVYLLVTTDSEDEAHEERNLVRLYNLLAEMPGRTVQQRHYFCDVLDAIEKKVDGEERGLKMTPQTLTIWRKTLDDA